jgi:hypothetical protein
VSLRDSFPIRTALSSIRKTSSSTFIIYKWLSLLALRLSFVPVSSREYRRENERHCSTTSRRVSTMYRGILSAGRFKTMVRASPCNSVYQTVYSEERGLYFCGFGVCMVVHLSAVSFNQVVSFACLDLYCA